MPGPKKVDDGITDEAEAQRHEANYGRIPRSQGLRGPVASTVRREDADARFGPEPAERKTFRKGGKVKAGQGSGIGRLQRSRGK